MCVCVYQLILLFQLDAIGMLRRDCAPDEIVCQLNVADVTSAISGFIQGAVQGNNPDAHFPVTTLCDMLEKEKDASGNLNALAVYIHNMTGSECLDIDAVKQLKQVGADRSWTFQTCTGTWLFPHHVLINALPRIRFLSN